MARLLRRQAARADPDRPGGDVPGRRARLSLASRPGRDPGPLRPGRLRSADRRDLRLRRGRATPSSVRPPPHLERAVLLRDRLVRGRRGEDRSRRHHPLLRGGPGGGNSLGRIPLQDVGSPCGRSRHLALRPSREPRARRRDHGFGRGDVVPDGDHRADRVLVPLPRAVPLRAPRAPRRPRLRRGEPRRDEARVHVLARLLRPRPLLADGHAALAGASPRADLGPRLLRRLPGGDPALRPEDAGEGGAGGCARIRPGSRASVRLSTRAASPSGSSPPSEGRGTSRASTRASRVSGSPSATSTPSTRRRCGRWEPRASSSSGTRSRRSSGPDRRT